MNIKEGIKRIYIVLSVIWFLFWTLIAITDKSLFSFFIGLLLPLILYFILKWIIQGFEN